MNIQQIESAIGIPVRKWPGRCSEIANLVLEAGLVSNGVSRYGHFRGDVHPESIFYHMHELTSFVRHGWIEEKEVVDCIDCDHWDWREEKCTNDDDCDDNVFVYIVDPTRWVFECVAPYVYDEIKGYRQESEYDIGGNIMRSLLRGKFPCPAGAPRYIRLFDTMPPHIGEALCSIAGLTTKNVWEIELTLQQTVWFANLSPTLLGNCAAPLYMRLIYLSKAAFIPIDNRRLILG